MTIMSGFNIWELAQISKAFIKRWEMFPSTENIYDNNNKVAEDSRLMDTNQLQELVK